MKITERGYIGFGMLAVSLSASMWAFGPARRATAREANLPAERSAGAEAAQGANPAAEAAGNQSPEAAGTQAAEPAKARPWGSLPHIEFPALDGGARGHGSVVAAGRLFVVGGARGGEGSAEPAGSSVAAVSSRVVSYPILPGGGLGRAREEASLPAPLSGLTNACVAWDDRVIFVAGGGSTPDGHGAASNRVLIGGVGKDGAVSAWEFSAPWPGPALSRCAVVAAPAALLVIGGVDPEGNGSADVFRAGIEPDGRLGAWTKQAALPEGRLGHAAGMSGRRVFVAGGRAGIGKGPRIEVWSASLETSDTLAGWTAELMTLPRGVSDGCGLVVGPRLYWIGGVGSGGGAFDSIVYSFLRDGRATPWKSLDVALPAPVDLAAAAADQGRRMYFSGGFSPAGGGQEQGGGLSRNIVVVGLAPGAVGGDASTRGAGAVTDAGRDPLGLSARPEAHPNAKQLGSRLLSESDAFDEARRRRQPMLLIVYSSEDEQNAKLRRDVLATPRFLNSMTGMVVGEADVAADPAALQRHGVDSLPTFLVYDREGNLKRKDAQARSIQDFAAITFDVR